ncbi:unnamed protein product [Cylindrotheca closterium]|uniref:Uncharacterized protein n=1 Tax=Cylindrotheca closterium TaxID=2856 RepID=A0AAD2FXH4_9STRA|nr:unnamed protein product [Cylindrotheca closterium]
MESKKNMTSFALDQKNISSTMDTKRNMTAFTLLLQKNNTCTLDSNKKNKTTPPTRTVSLDLDFGFLSLAMDLIDIIFMECQELYAKYQPLAMDLLDAVSMECRELYKTYQPLALDFFDTATAQCQRLYEKYQPRGVHLVKMAATKLQEFYKTVKPLAIDLFERIIDACQSFMKDLYDDSSSSTAKPFDQASCIAFAQLGTFKSFNSCY